MYFLIFMSGNYITSILIINGNFKEKSPYFFKNTLQKYFSISIKVLF